VSRRIGIYGGAFNPPTKGHQHVIEAVLSLNVVDEIWVVPSFRHYHGKDMESYQHRMVMCSRAFMHLHTVLDMGIDGALNELVNDYDGSMISMLDGMRKHDNDAEYHLIIGQDNADTIHTWKNGTDLINNEKFIIVPRPNSSDLLGEWYKYEPHTFITDIKQIECSSTMVRDLCKRKSHNKISIPSETDKLRNIITESTLDFIVEHNLYKG